MLDLSGNGISVTQLTSSNTFEAIDRDGYRHRTAWAGTGNAVLFVDPNGLNTIRDADQYIFTDWDPSAKSDMEALRNIFDTNHDGKLDASDAAFGQFKLMVTNADGTTSVETLAQAGIASIDLHTNSITRAFADGSSIDGETTFTRTDGSTGTVAAVTLAADANGYAVQTTTTVNGDGSTTVDNRALNADGSLDNDTASTTSADGTTRTIAYDSTGIGVIDHTQTVIDTLNGATGDHVDTVSDYDGQGQLTRNVTTTTSADGLLVTITRDLTGGGITDQTETRQTGADGAVTDTLTDVAANGKVIDRTVTSSSADGLSKEIQVDSTGRADAAGNEIFDRTTLDITTVAADGSRSEIITVTNADGSEVANTVIGTSADSQTRISSLDRDGDGTVDQVVVARTTPYADGSTTTNVTIYDGARTNVLDSTATTLSADGLTKTTRLDMDGDLVADRTTVDSTSTNERGGQTEDVRTTSVDGTLLSEVVTARSTDGVSRNVAHYDGSGKLLSLDKIGVGPQGATTETASTFGSDGTLLGRTEKTTSADGLTTTTRTDTAGDGSFDRTVVDQTTKNGDGSATEVVGTRSADDTLLGRTTVTTSADGLTVTTRVDSSGALNADGTGIFDRTTTDTTSYTAAGDRIRAVTVTSADGTLLSSVTTDTAPDRQSRTVTTDANGDGFTTTLEQVTIAADGTTTDSITDYNPDGSIVDAAVRTTSANGLRVTTQIDAAGTGTYNRTTTDVTTIAADGQRSEVVTSTSANGDVVGRTVMLSQANGDSSSMRVDTTGSGTFDHVTNTARVFNTDGSTTVTVTDKAANGSTRDATATTTSGNGLTVTTRHDLDGDGTFDQTTVATTVYAAHGDVTKTTTDLYGDGSDATALRDRTVSTTSGDGFHLTSRTEYEGSVVFGTAETRDTQANGDVVDTTTTFATPDGSGAALTATRVTMSGNGLSKTTAVDVDGDGTFDTTMTDATVLADNGDRIETITRSGSAGLNGRTVVTTSGNGLSRTVTSDTVGHGTVDTTTHDDTTLNADGSRREVYTQTNQDGSLRNSTTITTSADRKHVTVGRVLGQDGSQSETIDRGDDGTVTDVLRDTDALGMALGGETVTTSANGLLKVATYTDAAGTVQDVQTDLRILESDGSTTEQFTDVDHAAGVSATFHINTSGNGLVKTTEARFSGLPFTDYSTLDTTTLHNDGSLDDTITTTNADGSTRDQSVRTVSADGLLTTSRLDDDADGNAEITDRKEMATDGSMVRTTTIYNSATHAQDRRDIVTTSADGRTVTLQSARDGDPTVRYTETLVENPDGTYSDKSQFVSGTLAPSWTQIRSQTRDTTGGQTVVISNYDAAGGLADRASTTVSGNGLVVQTALDTTGNGTDDLVQTDSTVVNGDGTRFETVARTLAPGVAMAGPGTKLSQRSVGTSADGLTVRTDTDDDGNGIFEKFETSVRGIDGSLVDTVAFLDNTTGEAVKAQAADGSTSAGIVKTTSADGLVVTTVVGGITTQKTYLAGSNGSYRWTQNTNGLFAIPSASHSVDVNGVDTWTSSYVPDANVNIGPNTTTTIQIDVAKERAAIAQANSIYQTILNRPMMDAEQESLIQYMQGGILDRQALAKSLIGNSAAFDLNFIDTAYENDFGHDPSASDTAAYLKELQSGNRAETRAQVAVDIAEKAVNEQAGNGLLALLPGAPQATPMTVTLIPPETAALTDTGANYAAFVNAIGKPSGNLTPGQISQFGALAGDPDAASAPRIDFASASSSTSGQGTAVPGFFGGPSTPAAKPPTGGAAGPLVVNLAGGAVHTTDLATSTVHFDDTGSGTASTTAWTTPNEGFLVLDPGGVQVTDGTAFIPTFSALAQYDANRDGTLTAAEAAASGIRIWVDANGDGVDQQGEVESLGQAGIASIDLRDVQTGRYDHGNIIAADSTVTFTSGQTGHVGDAWLAYGGALAQGAVYQFGDDVVLRAADGTASELLYGSGETVDAGAAGLSRIVDLGANNVLQAGTGATVTLSGGAGDRLIGGSGTDTLLAIGDGETVKTGTGANRVSVSGAGTSVDASLGTATISLAGTNDSVTGATAATTIDVTKGTGARIGATGSVITIEGGVGAEISGSGDHITAAGRSTITLDASGSTLTSDAASTVVLNGSNDALTLDRSSTVSVAGTGETIALNSGTLTLAAGASARVTGNDDFATQAAGSALSLVGRGGAVDVTGVGAVTALDYGVVVLENGASDAFTGSGAQVVQNAGTTLSLSGTGASVVVTGSGNTSTLSDARVTVQAGASSHVTGSRDVIAAGPTGLTGTLVGSDNRVTISGTGAQLSIDGQRDILAMSGGQLQLADHSSASLTGASDTAILYAFGSLEVVGSGDTVTAYGQNDLVSITGDNGIITGDGGGDTLTLIGSGGSVTAYGAGTTVRVTGSNNTVTADGYQDALILSGTGETVTANNSSTVTLLDGSSATVSGGQNAVMLGANSTLVLTGSGDTVTASGAGDTVTVTGQGDRVTATGQNDTIRIASSGNVVSARSSTVVQSDNVSLVATGNDDTLTLGSNDTLNLSGNRDSIVLRGTNDVVNVTGIGDSVSGGGAGATINLSGTGAQMSVSAAALHLSDGATGTLTGANDTATLGSNGTLAVVGSNDTVSAYGQNDTVTVTGSGDAVVADGYNTSVSANGSNNTLTAYGQNDTVTVTGSNNTVTAYGYQDTVNLAGTSESVTGNSAIVTLAAGSSATLSGYNNTITLNGAGDVIVLAGGNDIVTGTGAGDVVTLEQNGDSVTIGGGSLTLWSNITAAVNGVGNAIVLASNDTLNLGGSGHHVMLGGSNDTVQDHGSNDTIFESGSNETVTLAGRGDTVTSGSISVVQAGDGSLSVYGGLASSAVTTSSSSPRISLGNGNTVSSTATPATITGYGSNGLHSWQDIFDTMSGALKETDQYQYNAQNQLMEVDKYNGAGSKTEADLYDPKTSAEIGSYLYGSNGSVNEVVDLLHNHDWLSQSNGTYKDKTSGAVSQTQPTLR